MFQKIKNFLKRILPPPVKAFNREVERILSVIRAQGKAIQSGVREQGKSITTVLERLGAGQAGLGQKIRALRDESADSLQGLRREMAESLSAIQDSQKALSETLGAVLATQGVLMENIAETQRVIAVQLNQLHEEHREMTRMAEVTASENKTRYEAWIEENARQHTQDKEETDARFAALSEENATLRRVVEQQKKELEAIRKQVQQTERRVMQRFDKERIELRYEYYRRLPPDKYAKELALWYRQRMGKPLNLREPKTFNEKIQWLKLYNSTPLKTRLADKYLVRDWVKDKIGEEYLIPLLGVWDSFDEIDFDQLPGQFVLKANHGCGMNIIVKDKAQFDKVDAKKKFDMWMRTNYAFSGNLRGFSGGLQLHYMNIPPKIIAEKYLENSNDDLHDYKVYCFDGKANCIQFLYERNQELKMAFFDLNWNKLTFVNNNPMITAEIPKPVNLDLLIQLSEKLAEGFPYVRVDFYILNDGTLRFGEMTFTPVNGIAEWNPPEQDRIFGDLLQLPPKSEMPEFKL